MSTDRMPCPAPGSDEWWVGSPSHNEHDARLRRGVRDLANAVPVPEIGPAGLRAAAARRRVRPRARGRWLPALAAATTALAIVAVGLLPGMPTDLGATPLRDADVAVLPKTFAVNSYLTAHVSADPPGPVIGLYSYSQGVFPAPGVLVVGVNGRSFRELDAASRPSRGYPGSHRSALTLLSPDGTKVAVGDSPSSIAVVDLVNGKARRYQVHGVARQFLAWSPDSRRLLYLALPRVPAMFEEPREGEPVVLDLGSGSSAVIPGQRGTVDAAYASDGSRLALQRQGELRIVRLDGAVERTLSLPDRHRLAGAAAWSPDGSRLALYRMGEVTGQGTPDSVYGLRGEGSPDGLAVLDLDSGDTFALGPLSDLRTLLGWRGDRLVVDRWETIAQLPVAGGPAEQLAMLEPGHGNFTDLQLATALLPTVEVRDAGRDQGPWPVWLMLVVASSGLVAAGLGILVTRALRRRGPLP
ncbi:WD40 repeat domain-containing protein [Asanoa siamensis]|uniref:WD40 repeat protein n=1 Tax=Asanoa siamensis TaxID=926357 RepID=A0ABQ4D0I4_9ACTN|nr:PD40 domain-containing protein [Asanoa siamensis]GIF77037.1 hypothetical protein Asi02nite_65550 [Asanoa siamensis]